MKITVSQIHNFRQNESPVLIVGAPRSGTSLLYRILQKHSSFKLPGDDISVNLVESNIFSKPYNLSEANKLSYLLDKREIYDKFLTETQGIRQYQNLIAAEFIFGKLYRKEKFSALRKLTWKIT
ncbi:MAG: sulfotransferase, partial [Snowella sp.]